MKKLSNIPVQIKELEIFNFKNVKNGKITLIKGDTKDIHENIIALYGQNGSGKTTFVNTLYLLKSYISFEPLQMFNKKLDDIQDYFAIDSDTFKLKSKFNIRIKNKSYTVNYLIEFSRKINEKNFYIRKEKISYLTDDLEETCLEHSNGKYIWSENIEKDVEKIKNTLIVAEKISGETKRSFVFNELLINDYIQLKSTNVLGEVLRDLQIFARLNMFVITNKQFGMIDLRWNLPFMFRLSKDKKIINEENNFVGREEITSGGEVINLKNPQKVTNTFFEDLTTMFNMINDFLIRIIPSMRIDILSSPCILDNGEEGKYIELFTVRNGVKIPMRNESTGVLKLISIIQVLITYCVYDDIFLAIDEFDAGIFEHLLGKLLELLSREGKGQLFITSHNLRPLEILNKNCLYFSTTNPSNRYIKLTNVKTNNNVRDFYLRALELGGQKEEIYSNDDMAAITILLKRLERLEKNEQ